MTPDRLAEIKVTKVVCGSVRYHNEGGQWWCEDADLPGWTGIATTQAEVEVLRREECAMRPLRAEVERLTAERDKAISTWESAIALLKVDAAKHDRIMVKNLSLHEALAASKARVERLREALEGLCGWTNEHGARIEAFVECEYEMRLARAALAETEDSNG